MGGEVSMPSKMLSEMAISVRCLAETFGWIVWGKPKARPHNGSVYQCFRKGNKYLWIGNRFVERSDDPIALDFVTASRQKLYGFLL